MNCFRSYVMLAFICVVLCFPFKARANHIMGADIGWKYLAGDTFLFTVSVYRSCDGIALANTPFKYFSDCSGYTVPTAVYGKMCCTKDITPDLGYGCSRCSGAKCENPFGIQLILIQAKIVFPKGCCKWYVSWEQSSRDGAITTGAAGKNFYTEAEIDICQINPRDNSPVFQQLALNLFCVSQCQSVDYSAKDPDHNSKNGNDSLFYSLVPPLEAHGVPISYNKGYSYRYPFKFEIPIDGTDLKPCDTVSFTLDRNKGTLNLRPSKTEISVMALKVDEYRPDSLGNLHKIGSIRRDIEIFSTGFCSSISSNDHSPVITGINGGTSNGIKICSQSQTCFQVKSFDIDPKDSVKMKWDDSIPGATFKILDTTKKWPTGVFCWRPKTSDVRSAPYKFTVSVNDNSKPLQGKASRPFRIYVLNSPVAKYYFKIDHCGLVTFHADPDSGATISDYIWTGEGASGYGPLFSHLNNARYQYTKGGTYRFTLAVTSPEGCSRSYTDSFTIPPFPVVNLSKMKDTIVCEKSPNISLKAIPLYGAAPFFYKWNTGETADTKNATIKSDTFFVIALNDATGCGSIDTIHIKFQKIPKPKPPTQIYTCSGQGAVLHPTVSSQVIWTKVAGNKTTYNFSTANPLIAIDSGTYIAQALNGSICPGTDSFIVNYLPKLLAAKIDTDVCFGDTIKLDKTIYGNNGLIVATNPAGYKLHFIVKLTRHGVTCSDSGIMVIHVHPKPQPKLTAPPDQCIHNPALSLDHYVDPAHYGGYWYYANNVPAIVSNYLYPATMGVTNNLKNPGFIHYSYSDQYGCTSNDSVRVRIYDKPYAGPDATFWRQCGKYMLSSNAVPWPGGTWAVDSGTPTSALEISGDTAYFNPDSVKVYGRYGFVYSYKSKTGGTLCDGSDTVFINFSAKPIIIVSKPDSQCENGDPIILSAIPLGGIWTLADSTNKNALDFDANSNNYSFMPSLAGPGVHKLIYSFAFDALHPQCAFTAPLSIFVIQKPIVDFKTSDKKWAYCSSEQSVMLIPDKPGGVFTGPGITYSGDTSYFNPSLTTKTASSITYSMPYRQGLCKSIVTHVINVDPAPRVFLLNDTVMCADNNTFVLKAKLSNVSKILWNSAYKGQDGGYFAERTKKDSLITVRYVPGPDQLNEKHFTVSITAFGNGLCDSIQLNYHFRIKAGPVADFISDREECEPFTTSFKSLSTTPFGKITGYDWSFGDSSAHSILPGPVHTYVSDSITRFSFYTVKLSVSTDEGCRTTISKKDWIIVLGAPRPVIKVIPNFTTLDRATIQFGIDPRSLNMDTTDTTTKYFWDFGEKDNRGVHATSTLNSPQYTYKDTGHFNVILKVTNADGCIGTDSAYHLVNIVPAYAIFIPNAFVPGNKKDGSPYVNKYFKPVISSGANYEMTIYNRWGELVYRSKNTDPGWDGTFREMASPAGVYIFHITVRSLWAEPHSYSGTVNLLR